MHSTYFFSLLASVALVAASYDVNFEDHFATEDLVKKAPAYDLTNFGYHTQLPRVYDLTSGDRPVYQPRESFEHFNEVVAGRRNASEVLRRGFTSDRFRTRANKNAITMTVENGAETKNDFNVFGDEECLSGDATPYTKVTVHYAEEVYVTFWESDVCNGAKGSFNPTCSQEGNQYCTLQANKRSFRVYSGCHDDKDNDGCT